MLNKIFKINKKENVNIWVKRSVVKVKKKRLTLIEVVMPKNHLFMFKEGVYFEKFQENPVSVFDSLKEETSSKVKKHVKTDGFFYYNGQKIDVKEELR